MKKNDPKKLASSLRGKLKNLKVIRNTNCSLPDITLRIMQLSKELFPNDPIVKIVGEDFDDLTGMLINIKGRWNIIYNNNLPEKMINFTIAHEFGHYLMHRNSSNKIECQPKGKYKWNSEYGKMEKEADTFASNLIISDDELKIELRGKAVCFSMFELIAKKYEASLMVIILRWIDITDQKAMFVFAREGFIDWARSSKSLFQDGIFYSARQKTTELPAQSLAYQYDKISTQESETVHNESIWIGNQYVYEKTRFSKDGITMTILMYDNDNLRIYSKNKDKAECFLAAVRAL